jgi:hypothetical protein
LERAILLKERGALQHNKRKKEIKKTSSRRSMAYKKK